MKVYTFLCKCGGMHVCSGTTMMQSRQKSTWVGSPNGFAIWIDGERSCWQPENPSTVVVWCRLLLASLLCMGDMMMGWSNLNSPSLCGARCHMIMYVCVKIKTNQTFGDWVTGHLYFTVEVLQLLLTVAWDA